MDRQIQFDNEGLLLNREGELAGSLKWMEVDKISAFKAYVATFHLLCLKFYCSNKAASIEVDEDMKGFSDLKNKLTVLFPEADPGWEGKVKISKSCPEEVILFERQR